MRGLSSILALGLVAFAGTVWAEDAPPPPPSWEPAPIPAPTAPTPTEQRRAVDQAPPTVFVAPPATRYPAAYPMSAAACAPARPACCQKRDNCGCPIDECGNRYGPWTVTVEGGVTLLNDPDGVFGEPLFVPGPQLSFEDIDYDPTFGGRVTIGHRIECNTRIEFRGTYWGTTETDDEQAGSFAARPGAGGLGDISAPVAAVFDMESTLWGVELNWWNELSCTGSWRWDAGLGARYLSFEEDAFIGLTPTGGGLFPVGTGFVSSEVKNSFMGGQALLAGHYDASDRLELFASAKALFGSIQRDIDVADLNLFAGGPHASSSDDDEFVFGVNFELGAKFRINKHLIVGASYELLFVDNVQRAEDAFDFSQSNSGAVQARQAPDQLVAHSLWLGVTLQF